MHQQAPAAGGKGGARDGGEALLHAGFLRRFREVCPADWRVSVETSLAVPPDAVRTAAEAVDFFIVDCKDMDGEIYFRYTGGDGALMRENLVLLLSLVGPARIRVRVPRIPEYNTAEDQARSAAALRALGVENVELFDYVIRPDA